MIRLSTFLTLCFFAAGASAQTAEPIGWATVGNGTTGGDGGDTVIVTGRNAFVNAVADDIPRVVLIQDTITLITFERIDVGSNKSLVGLGYDATLFAGGLEIKGNNVIVQNVRITGSYDGDWEGKTNSTDALTITGTNIWIDHCDLSASADGLLDIRADGPDAGDLVTVSWTRFSNHNKVMLFGASDDEIQNRGKLRTTIHHCWFDGLPGRGINQRMPRVRFGDVHVFNNFFDKTASYAIAARLESDVVVENNYFRNCSNPHEMADFGQGLEDPDLVASGNVYEFSSGAQLARGEAFDPSAFYPYALQPAEAMPALLINEAGLFNDPANVAPLARPDTIVRTPDDTRTFLFDPIENDEDTDGGDLRLVSLLNTPLGFTRIQDNALFYARPSQAVAMDSLIYLLADTQGGLDTGRVIIRFEVATGIFTRPKDIQALDLFPNPASGQLWISYPARMGPEVDLHLYDLSGKIFRPAFSYSGMAAGDRHRLSLDTTQLASGTYWIQVVNGDQIATGKLLVGQ